MRTPFGERLERWCTDPRAPHAIVMPGREVSFADLRRRVLACAAWLVAEGCRPSEVVGITIADEVAHLTVSLALLQLGVPQACLPTHDPPAMRLRLAERLEAGRIVAVDPRHALPGRTATLTAPAALDRAASRGPCDALAADPDATALYFTSSGTTGEPKILPMTQRQLAGRMGSRNLEAGERTLLLSSVEGYPAKISRLGAVYRGTTSVLQPAGPAHDLCSALGVTRIDVGVLQAAELVRDGADPLPTNVKVFAGGSRVPMTLRSAYRERGGARLYVLYGAREASGFSSTFPVDLDPDLETVGPPLPSIELEIVDGEGRPVPRGEMGEIRVRSEFMIRGYHRDPVATARHFRDGWFMPGDLVSLTANGSLRVHGRADDMMNLNGIKIFPAEIERVLEDDPAVTAAAAFALPSAIHGEIPVAAVEVRGPEKPDVAALISRARAHLGVRAPRRIYIVDALPRNTAGKVMKRELVALVSAKH